MTKIPPFRFTGISVDRLGKDVSLVISHADEYAAMSTYDRLQAAARKGRIRVDLRTTGGHIVERRP